MSMKDVTAQFEESVMKTYGRIPFAFERGEGVTLYDLNGTAYLDFNSGLGVNALGHCHPKVSEFIKTQADKVIHTSNLYYIPSQGALAKKICAASFGERVFFCTSGTEAVEGALKFARKRGKQLSPEKTDVIAFANSFHGRTFGALSATMQDKYQKGFTPLLPGFKKAEFNDLVSVEALVDDATAAVIVEPVQGEGGVNVADAAFMTGLAKLAKERDFLLIVDEVQCGMGRTGKLFAYEHYGIEPDIMSLAKPLAGGLPIGATVSGPRVWPSIKPGDHASTFGGNHFTTGVAVGVFDMLADPAFLDDVAAKGGYIMARLNDMKQSFPCIKDLRGKGLLIGIEVDFPASEAVSFFQNEHILICSAGPNVIRFIPPLIVTRNDIDRVLDTLDRFLATR